MQYFNKIICYFKNVVYICIKKQGQQQNLYTMTQKRFHHQLGVAIIRIYPDGTAIYNKKRYSSYKSARRALTNHVGFAWEER